MGIPPNGTTVVYCMVNRADYDASPWTGAAMLCGVMPSIYFVEKGRGRTFWWPPEKYSILSYSICSGAHTERPVSAACSLPDTVEGRCQPQALAMLSLQR